MCEAEARLAELFIAGRCAFDYEETERVCSALLQLKKEVERLRNGGGKAGQELNHEGI